MDSELLHREAAESTVSPADETGLQDRWAEEWGLAQRSTPPSKTGFTPWGLFQDMDGIDGQHPNPGSVWP